MRQAEALEILKTGVNAFLTGEPGSGKTHTINEYTNWLRERGVEPAVTASTGIAATHVDGMTIHSWSGIGVNRDVSDWDIEMIAGREKTARRIGDAKVLIIDEVSMLDGRTLASVDRVLRALRRQQRPFGGLQVIFVGDFFQLPPVSRGEAAQFAFQSRAWREANPIVCYLSEQHRQEDEEFLDLLGAVRRGELDDVHYERLQARMNAPSESDVATRLYTHNANVDAMNTESLHALKTEGKRYTMHSQGPARLVETLKSNCLSPEMLEVREGARVMFTRNNFEAGYVNGTLGEVIGFSSSGLPQVKTAKGTLEAAPVEWAVQDGAKVLARISQVPLRLAWAITVHKSQGMSLDAAVIDLGRAFEYGQGYVAISRVRSLKGLFLAGFNSRALQLHPEVADADRGFRAYSDAARNKFASLENSERGELTERFLQGIGASAPKKHAAKKIAKGALGDLKEKYPNMGKPWGAMDDKKLSAMFSEKVSNKEIAAHFGRKASAITSRLAHLGLIEDYWAKRHAKK
jgi:hypothetical protein